MGDGLVFEADLDTREHINRWILQGVCLTLNDDEWGVTDENLCKQKMKRINHGLRLDIYFQHLFTFSLCDLIHVFCQNLIKREKREKLQENVFGV